MPATYHVVYGPQRLILAFYLNLSRAQSEAKRLESRSGIPKYVGSAVWALPPSVGMVYPYPVSWGVR